MLEQCFKRYEQQDEATASLLLLKRIRGLAANKRYEKLKAADTIVFIQVSQSTRMCT